MSIQEMFYLAAVFGIPAIVLAASRFKFLPVKGNLKLALISFFILYAFVVGSARLSGYQIEQELHTFDLDGDGSFSSNEMIPEAKAALDRFAHDTGRAFALIHWLYLFIFICGNFLLGGSGCRKVCAKNHLTI